MNTRARVVFSVSFGIISLFLFCLPISVYAFGDSADLMCAGCQSVDASKPKYCINTPCHDTGSPTLGMCTPAQICAAKTAGGKGVDSGLSQLTGILGQLLGKLMQGSPSSPAAPAALPATLTTGCTGSYFQTSDVTQLSNPCAQYVAPALPTVIPVATSTSGSCDPISQLLGTCTASTGTGNTLSASPTSGVPPLTVTFSATVSSTSYTLDFGDGSDPQYGSCSDSCTSVPVNVTHTYTIAGNYTATLTDSTGASIGTASISVSSPLSQNTIPNQNTTVTPVISSAPTSTGPNTINLSGLGMPMLLAPGATNGQNGDIVVSGTGATIFGSSQDLANNVGVAGFFGDNTFGGAQPQGLAAQLCQSRPWATGALGSILPSSFFDGLCTWRGYQVGTPPAAPAPVVQLQQSAPAPAAPVVVASTSTVPIVPPKVQIWAVPPSVALDTRTSIFWNTQGVTNCSETSPDGSFNQNSLSGGAATVPLTGATTFTISCSDTNGNPVTGYVTVNLSI